MRYKILILNLLLALAFLPVAQAMSPVAAPMKHDHGSMGMNCGHADQAHCIDFDACLTDGHANCGTSLEAVQVLVKIADRPCSHAYAPDLAERFLSYHPQLLLRPPRNA